MCLNPRNDSLMTLHQVQSITSSKVREISTDCHNLMYLLRNESSFELPMKKSRVQKQISAKMEAPFYNRLAFKLWIMCAFKVLNPHM